MDVIFRGAMRVVAYLGTSTSKGNYPTRRNMQVLRRDTLDDMLELGYFTRLWVIQELILVRGVLFVYGGFECHAEQSTLPEIKWLQTRAPWLGYLSAGSFPPEHGLTGALRLTNRSKSTDVRDRLFRTMGLVRRGISRSLRPDYSISAIRLFVGVATHCLTNEYNQPDVLFNSISADG